MLRSITFMLLACGLAAGLEFKPAHAADAAKPGADSAWRPSSCPPPAETTKGPSSLKVTGPCEFEHRGMAECEIEHDDYNANFSRNAKDGNDVYVFISVEHHITPGRYKDNEVKLSVREKSNIYRWQTEKAEVTVGPGLKFITVHDAQLEPEPMLVGCSGPLGNYNCSGRGENESMLKSTVTVSGTIYCKPAGTKK